MLDEETSDAWEIRDRRGRTEAAMSSSRPERYAKAIRLVRVTLAAVGGGERMARHEGSGLASEPMSRAHGRAFGGSWSNQGVEDPGLPRVGG